MIGSMEDDHQWYDAARIEEVAAVTSGGLTISRAAWNQTASRQRWPPFFLLPETIRFRKPSGIYNKPVSEKSGAAGSDGEEDR